jgi:hypothetical protein
VAVEDVSSASVADAVCEAVGRDVSREGLASWSEVGKRILESYRDC